MLDSGAKSMFFLYISSRRDRDRCLKYFPGMNTYVIGPYAVVEATPANGKVT